MAFDRAGNSLFGFRANRSLFCQKRANRFLVLFFVKSDVCSFKKRVSDESDSLMGIKKG